MTIRGADEEGIILTDADIGRVEWDKVLGIYGAKLPEDCDRFHLFVDVFESGLRRFDIVETHDAFRDVLRAIDRHLVNVVEEENRLTVDWDRLIRDSTSNERVLIWFADDYFPGSWPAAPEEPPGFLQCNSPFRQEEIDDPTDRSEADEPYYEWLDAEATKLQVKPVCEHSMFEILYWLQAEVLNGGLHQYFTNSFGNRANDAVNVLRCISALDAADALESAIRIAFNDECPHDITVRQELLENPDDDLLRALDQLDYSVATGWLGLLHNHLTSNKSI